MGLATISCSLQLPSSNRSCMHVEDEEGTRVHEYYSLMWPTVTLPTLGACLPIFQYGFAETAV
eukprot:c27671_g1_i1 orf=149-337(+)